MQDKDYSRRIRKLRAALRITQHTLADRLRVRPQVVASWEQGRREPAASSYQGLARLASPADAWFFLQKMGVTKKLVQAKWIKDRKRPARKKDRLPPFVLSMDEATQGQVRIPLLRERAPADLRKLRTRDIATFLSIPAALLPSSSGKYLAI